MNENLHASAWRNRRNMCQWAVVEETEDGWSTLLTGYAPNLLIAKVAARKAKANINRGVWEMPTVSNIDVCEAITRQLSDWEKSTRSGTVKHAIIADQLEYLLNQLAKTGE